MPRRRPTIGKARKRTPEPATPVTPIDPNVETMKATFQDAKAAWGHAFNLSDLIASIEGQIATTPAEHPQHGKAVYMRHLIDAMQRAAQDGNVDKALAIAIQIGAASVRLEHTPLQLAARHAVGVVCQGQWLKIPLNGNEWKILHCFDAHREVHLHDFTRAVWDRPYRPEDTGDIRTAIARLNAKLSAAGCPARLHISGDYVVIR